ncbi:MAG: ABC transporter permease/substrate-binding protein [Myxococcales bacterium]|nr:ABC transporter permease/substrate-binding protein [Myxococcales bacterium]
MTDPLLAALPERLAAHVALALTALAAGIAVALPLGVWASRRPRVALSVGAVAGAVQTVPSLALLAFMVPLLAAMGLRAIGYLPALLALSLYSVLPVLRNTVAAMRALDPAVLEAADGVGMTPGQRLFRVELPLAAPLVVAGVRTSVVWTVGSATLSTPVGATSLGDYIFAGLQTSNHRSVLVGCVASALLALALDAIVALAERGFVRRRRAWIASALVALLVIVAGASVTLARGRRASGRGAITIGAKTFTEQYILARVLSRQIQRRAGSEARVLDSLGSTVAFDALAANQIDAYVDYTGTLWTTILHRAEIIRDRRRLRDELDRALRARYGVRIVASLGFENTYAIAVRRSLATERRLRTITDLARESPSLSIAGDYEIFSRPEWRTIEQAYAPRFASQRSMDPALLYDAARSGQVDAITAFSTDGRIATYDLVVCDDDRAVIPPYDAVVLVSARVARERPDVVAALAALERSIDAAAMRAANARVDAQHEDPGRVAETLLRR